MMLGAGGAVKRTRARGPSLTGTWAAVAGDWVARGLAGGGKLVAPGLVPELPCACCSTRLSTISNPCVMQHTALCNGRVGGP